MQVPLLFSVLRGKYISSVYATSDTDEVVKRLVRHRRSLDHSFPRLLSPLLGTTTTCRSRFCLDCERPYPTRHLNKAHTEAFSGTVSTVFLFMVDVDKSRVECEEFVAAEVRHDAFSISSI